MAQVTFNEWIRSKRVPDMAAALDVAEGTIYSWVSRGTVPRSVWPTICIAYAELGLNDLIKMEAESKADEK